MTHSLPFLIIGCGYVGTRLARTEATRRRVVAVLRTESRAAELHRAGIEPLRMDLDDDDASETGRRLAKAARGAAIVYLAPPPDQGTTDPRLESFLRLIDDAAPAMFLYVSTTGVYGDAGGALVDERSPTVPREDRSRRRLAAERAATTWCEARTTRCVVLRVPAIYGPHRLPLERLERGEPALRAEDAGPGNRIHVDDLVATIVAAVDDRQAQGIFNVTDGDHASTTVYLQETAAAAGLPPPALVTRAEASSRISPGLLAYLLESRRVDNRRMREELGVQPRYASLAQGVRASVAEMRNATDTPGETQ